MNTLIYRLDVLKIKEDTEVYRNAVELEERVSIESSTAFTIQANNKGGNNIQRLIGASLHMLDFYGVSQTNHITNSLQVNNIHIDHLKKNRKNAIIVRIIDYFSLCRKFRK